MEGNGQVRIGELARRTGVTVELLRAWEKRYGLLQPSRTNSGYRLYSPADEERIVRMRRGLADGLAAAEAARAALEEPVLGGGNLSDAAAELRSALEVYDDATAQSALDVLLATFTFETVARDVMVPLLREIGERWERGEISVAQEHFASSLLRGRLMSIARGWDRGVGPRAVLACAPAERHELMLIIFGIALIARVNGMALMIGGTIALSLTVGYVVVYVHRALQQEQAPRMWYVTLYAISGLAFAFGVGFLLRVVRFFGLL